MKGVSVFTLSASVLTPWASLQALAELSCLASCHLILHIGLLPFPHALDYIPETFWLPELPGPDFPLFYILYPWVQPSNPEFQRLIPSLAWKGRSDKFPATIDGT